MGAIFFLKAHGLQSFLCGEFGTSGVIGVIHIACIKERGLLKGQCCVVATENLAVILGLSLADVGNKGNACEQVWLEDDGCLVACSIFVRLKGEKT